MQKQKIIDPYDVELDEYEKDIVDNFDKHIELESEEKQTKIAEFVEIAKNHNKKSSGTSASNSSIGNGILDVKMHYNQKDYPHQYIMYLSIEEKVYAVPCVEEENGYFLITIIPDKNARNRYLPSNE